MPGRLPRASGTAPVVIDPLVWNDVCDRLERVENLAVSDPLQLMTSGAGNRLSLKRLKPRVVPVKVTGTRGGDGLYTIDVGRWLSTAPIPAGTAYSLSAATDFADAYEATLANSAESEVATHRIGTGTIVPAWFTETFDDGGKEIWLALYNHAVRFVRQNPTTLNLEYTSHDAATADDVPSGDWIVFATATVCTTTPTATLMQLMNPAAY